MNLKIKNFVLIQQEYGFDLIKLVKSKRLGDGTFSNPTGEEYEKEVEVGYNMSLETCLEKIIHLNLLDREETVGLQAYIEAYKKEKSEILNILK